MSESQEQPLFVNNNSSLESSVDIVGASESRPDEFWQEYGRRIEQNKAAQEQVLSQDAIEGEARNKALLTMKSLEGLQQIVSEKNTMAHEAYLQAQKEGRVFLGINEGDTVQTDDGSLLVQGVDSTSRVMKVMEMDLQQNHAGTTQEISFSDFLDGAESVVAIDKLSRYKQAETKEETPEPTPAFVEKEESLSQPKEKWKLFQEATVLSAQEQVAVDERKKWLAAAFLSEKSKGYDLGVAKEDIVKTIKERLLLDRFRSDKQETILDQKLGSKAWQDGMRVLERFADRDLSFEDLLVRAKTQDNLRALKLFSAALLEPYISKEGRVSWDSLSERDKRMARLGELMGLEIERRQIELSGDKMDQAVAQRAFDRYQAYLENPDVPEMLRERFAETTQHLQERYSLSLEARKPTAEFSSEQEKPTPFSKETQETTRSQEITEYILSKADENLDQILSESQRATMTQDFERVSKAVFEQDPELRQLAYEMYESEYFSYDQSLIDDLKGSYHNPNVVDEDYRKKFIDFLPQQMKYVSLVNNKAGFWEGMRNKVFRNWVDGLDVRFQIFGLKGIMRPRWAKERLKLIRLDVMKSFAVMAQEKPERRALAFWHMAELGLTNIHETPSTPTPAQQSPSTKTTYRINEAEFDTLINNYYAGQAKPGQMTDTEFDRTIRGYYASQPAGSPSSNKTLAA